MYSLGERELVKLIIGRLKAIQIWSKCEIDTMEKYSAYSLETEVNITNHGHIWGNGENYSQTE